MIRVSKALAAKLLGQQPKPKSTTRKRETRTKRKPDLRPLERDIQRDILVYLRSVGGVWAVRVNSAGVKLPGRNGKTGFYRSNDRPGCPDILACVAGSPGICASFLAIEVKRPGEEPTDQQADCHTDIRLAGGVVLVAHCVQDVMDWINAA